MQLNLSTALVTVNPGMVLFRGTLQQILTVHKFHGCYRAPLALLYFT
jgi:hypothetical protein